jgi:hypothetical protein
VCSAGGEAGIMEMQLRGFHDLPATNMPNVRPPNGRAGLTTATNNAEVKTDSAPVGELPPTVSVGEPSMGLALEGGVRRSTHERSRSTTSR